MFHLEISHFSSLFVPLHFLFCFIKFDLCYFRYMLSINLTSPVAFCRNNIYRLNFIVLIYSLLKENKSFETFEIRRIDIFIDNCLNKKFVFQFFIFCCLQIQKVKNPKISTSKSLNASALHLSLPNRYPFIYFRLFFQKV